jgi:signal transduction histidine kinase
MRDPRHVLAVGTDEQSADAATKQLSDATVAVAHAADVTITLCRTAVDCLVVAQRADGVPADYLVYAARGLYPDLPVVVFGPDPPQTDDATTVEAERIDDARVVSAIQDTLTDNHDPDAARQPSRPETILASLFEEYPAHLYTKDSKARHLMASDHILDPTELLGLTDMETFGDEEYERANYSDDWQVIEDGEPVVEMDEYADDQDLFFRTSKIPWRGPDGDIIGLVGITQDITEMREDKDQLRRRNRRLRKVALVSSHELRNELQVLLRRCSELDTDEDRAADVTESIEHLTDIVDKIVSLATYTERERTRTTMWLSALVRDVWEGHPTSNASLTIESDRQVRGHRDATQLLVEMVVDNAIVHCGRDVSVTVGETDGGFYIADDGPGVAFDSPAHALEPGATTVENAAGVGLYIAQQIADEQGWTIEITNRADGGTRVEVTTVEES